MVAAGLAAVRAADDLPAAAPTEPAGLEPRPPVGAAEVTAAVCRPAELLVELAVD